MRIIDRYICRELLSHSLLALAVLTFALFVPRLVNLMDLLVRHSGGAADVAKLFLSSFPSVLSFTVPTAVLVGVLIGLSRMSSDSELIAMNTVGIRHRRLLVPVGLLALGAALLTLGMTAWLGPLSVRTLRALQDRLLTTQASFQVQPRVFDERLPRLILYVQDVSAAASRWRGVFLAESDAGDVSRLTLAEEAIVTSDREQDRLHVHLRNGSVHEFSLRDPEQYIISSFAQRDFAVDTTVLVQRAQLEPTHAELSLAALAAVSGEDAAQARIELHRRLAFPFACLVFALAAIPLGARFRRGGRSAGLVIALLLICGYYAIFVSGVGLARQGTLPPWLGVWAANMLIGLWGVLGLARVEQSQGAARFGHALSVLSDWGRWRPWRTSRRPGGPKIPPSERMEPVSRGTAGENEAPFIFRDTAHSSMDPARRPRTAGSFPQILDVYLLRNFLFYFVLLMAGFLLLYETITMFDLLEDIAQHRTGLREVAEYFWYLSYFLFYEFAPLGCLVSALVTLGVMTKNNELVALKAAGISLYRVAVPLLGAGLVFAVGLMVLDSTYLPYANQRQDALRNQIKGRPPQTYHQPRRQWIAGNNSKFYNYQLFDRDRNLFGGLQVLELDPATFAVRRRVYAARAHWEERQKAWILESGWVRDFQDHRVTRYASFDVLQLAELDEPPSYFSREVRQSYQMDWWELRQYIAELRQAGFDVARLSVQLYRKLAFPLIAPIVILLAVPFSILVGTRGAIGGLAMGIGVSFAYRGLSALCEALGAVGQLPPLLAAGSPDVIFVFLGLYFFLNMPT